MPSPLQELRQFAREFTSGKRIVTTFFEKDPITLDPEGLTRFRLKEEPRNVPDDLTEMFNFAIIECGVLDLAEQSQEVDVDSFITFEFDQIDKKIVRLDKKMIKAEQKNDIEEQNRITKKLGFLEQKIDRFDKMSENWWKSQTRKFTQGLYLGAILCAGEKFNTLKEQIRLEAGENP